MKHIMLLTFLTLPVFAQTPDQAQQRDAQKDLYERSIAHEVAVLTTLTQAGAGLSAATVGLLENGRAMVKAYNIADARAKDQVADALKQHEEAAHQAEYAAGVQGMINTHNAACHGTVTQDVYNWCVNVDTPRVQIAINTANEWGVKVNNWKATVDQAAAKVTADNQLVLNAEMDLKARMDAHQADIVKTINSYNASIQRIQNWSDQIKDLKAQFDECKQSLDAHETLEKIHEICGSKFDGNTIQQLYVDHPIPNLTLNVWKGPSFCSDNGKLCIDPANVPEIMVLH